MTIRSRGREPDGVLERGSGEIGFGGSSHVRGMGFGPLVALWALGLVGLALALNELRDVELNASFPSKFGLKYDMISLRNDLAILRDRLSLRHGVTMRVAPDGPAGRVYRFSVHRLALANCLEVRSLELRYQPSEAGLELRAVCRDRKRSAPRLHVGWSASAAVVQAVNRAEKIVVNLQ
jgi:hypothetical protein